MHRRRIASALAALVAIGAVVWAGSAIVAHPAWSAWETGLVIAVGSAHTVVLDVIALALHAAFGPVGGAMILAIAAGWVWISTRSRAQALRIALVIAVPWMLTEGVK